MNTMYPDATAEELSNTDNVCIICRSVRKNQKQVTYRYRFVSATVVNKLAFDPFS
jgi:hypothetical protein